MYFYIPKIILTITLSCGQDKYYEGEKSGMLADVTLGSQQQTRGRKEKAIVGQIGVRRNGIFIGKSPKEKIMALITEEERAVSGLGQKTFICRWGRAERASWSPWRTRVVTAVPRERRYHGPRYGKALTPGRILTKNQAK